MEGEFTGVATLDNHQNLRMSTDFRSVYKTLLEDWLGGDITGVLPNAAQFTQPRADQARSAPRRAARRSCSRRARRRPPRRGRTCGKRVACVGKVRAPAPGVPHRLDQARAAARSRRHRAGRPAARRRTARRQAGRPAAASAAPAARRTTRATCRSSRATPIRTAGSCSSPAPRCSPARSRWSSTTASPRTRTISGIRRGDTTYAFAELQNGEAATKHVGLAAGTWKLWCDIGDHQQRGHGRVRDA